MSDLIANLTIVMLAWATESCGAVATDVDTGERVDLCYSCGLPRNEHKPNCPETSDTIFEAAAATTSTTKELE